MCAWGLAAGPCLCLTARRALQTTRSSSSFPSAQLVEAPSGPPPRPTRPPVRPLVVSAAPDRGQHPLGRERTDLCDDSPILLPGEHILGPMRPQCSVGPPRHGDGGREAARSTPGLRAAPPRVPPLFRKSGSGPGTCRRRAAAHCRTPGCRSRPHPRQHIACFSRPGAGRGLGQAGGRGRPWLRAKEMLP